MKILKVLTMAAVAFGLLGTAAIADNNNLGDEDSMDVEINVGHFAEITVVDETISLDVDGTGSHDTYTADNPGGLFDIAANGAFNIEVSPDEYCQQSWQHQGVARNDDEPITYALMLNTNWDDAPGTGEWMDDNPNVSYNVDGTPYSRTMGLQIISQPEDILTDEGQALNGATGELPSEGNYEGVINLTVAPN